MIITQLAPDIYQVGGFFSYIDMLSIGDEFNGHTTSLGIKRDEYDDSLPPNLCLNKPSPNGIGDSIIFLDKAPMIKLLIKKIGQTSFDINLTKLNNF